MTGEDALDVHAQLPKVGRETHEGCNKGRQGKLDLGRKRRTGSFCGAERLEFLAPL